MDKPTISISVVYAESDTTWFRRELTMQEGATVRDALACSEILAAHPEWSLEQLCVQYSSEIARLPLFYCI